MMRRTADEARRGVYHREMALRAVWRAERDRDLRNARSWHDLHEKSIFEALCICSQLCKLDPANRAGYEKAFAEIESR